jgi:methylmalonic aciduria homocystinuria type C protein
MATATTDIVSRLILHLDPLGFECHPLLVGWYNERVGAKFALPFPHSTFAVVVLSRPDMFEKSFIPFLADAARSHNEGEGEGKRDPLDQCMRQTMTEAKETVFAASEKLTVIHDFELHPNRRPKFLAQTAAHVSGAVRLYQKCDVANQALLEDKVKSKKVYPVCIHPKFGGWFAIRCIFAFEEVSAPNLPRDGIHQSF